MSLCSLGISCDPICEHGVRINQQQCYFCTLKREFFDIVNELTERCNALQNQINVLHEHKLRQIDENRKVSRRLDNQYEYFRKLKSENKPHKCPICDGRGGFYISGTMDSECNTCQGKGILWG